jgi:hypothetical protein
MRPDQQTQKIVLAFLTNKQITTNKLKKTKNMQEDMISKYSQTCVQDLKKWLLFRRGCYLEGVPNIGIDFS